MLSVCRNLFFNYSCLYAIISAVLVKHVVRLVVGDWLKESSVVPTEEVVTVNIYSYTIFELLYRKVRSALRCS